MKRIPAILFCILFCVSFAGCSTSSGSVDSSLSLVSEFEEDRQAEAAGSSAPDTSETDNGRASESTGEATETTVPDNTVESQAGTPHTPDIRWNHRKQQNGHFQRCRYIQGSKANATNRFHGDQCCCRKHTQEGDRAWNKQADRDSKTHRNVQTNGHYHLIGNGRTRKDNSPFRNHRTGRNTDTCRDC